MDAFTDACAHAISSPRHTVKDERLCSAVSVPCPPHGFFFNPLLLDFTSVRIVPTSSLLGSVLPREDNRVPKGTVFGGQAGFLPV